MTQRPGFGRKAAALLGTLAALVVPAAGASAQTMVPSLGLWGIGGWNLGGGPLTSIRTGGWAFGSGPLTPIGPGGWNLGGGPLTSVAPIASFVVAPYNPFGPSAIGISGGQFAYQWDSPGFYGLTAPGAYFFGPEAYAPGYGGSAYFLP